jgi:hypothetical protein
MRSADVAREPDREAIARMLLDPFDAALGDLRARVDAAAPGVDVAFEKTRGTVTMAVAKLTDKIANARLHRDQTLVDEVRRVQWALAPGGEQQQRVYGLPYFAARYGERAIVTSVLDSITPFDPALKDITWASAGADATRRGRREGRV